MPFEVNDQNLAGLKLIIPRLFHDERGYFCEIYKKSDFRQQGIKELFIQDNFSLSRQGVLRGLHFQLPPYTQGKLVQCVRGQIFDVAVDIRVDSVTFGRWHSFDLSENNHHILYIPAGFAHGFLTLSADALVMYKATKEYAPEADRGIIWNDPEVAIKWPIIDNIIVSEKDKLHPTLDQLRKMLS